ncbi:hypothetical protein ASE92_06635 [Pedobacter sp. Leaf41]|uniref:TlpA family protein disulfide reductase n=1 Tax=Pedobacter sp. Leaf41 TaxID=1736218 RepID=UPI000703B127|nr:TlpA disulfide reductase family protein [Pedobacter sp. Leaf41]KQN35818.1 hypothetical protein ASE92_06635 [Pedobacter sp. Leaf41]
MIQKITIAIVMAMLCLNFWVIAQVKPEVLKPVKVGEQVPNEMWDMPMKIYKNGKYSTETLRKYKGKVIVIDFWATWCGYCVEGFPKLSKLQDSLESGLQVFLVNKKSVGDTPEKIARVYELNASHLKDMPIVVEDTILGQLFPTVSLPTYAVISGDRYLEGITQSYLFTEAAIVAIVKERNSLLEIRRRIKKEREGN